MRNPADLRIVALVASAGGLDAFITVLRASLAGSFGARAAAADLVLDVHDIGPALLDVVRISAP